MKIPRYIVIKLELKDKTTITATDITDRCEVYEYEADTSQTDVYDYKGNGKWERSEESE